MLIDNELLIDEVKKRASLYDKSNKEYTDLAYKRDMWEEICEKLFADSWQTYDDDERQVRVSETLKRWNNIRTCFSREVKNLKEGTSTKRRKYRYFDKLTFLLDVNCISSYNSERDSIPDIEDDKSDDEDSVETKAKITPKKRKRANGSKVKDGIKRNVEKYVQLSFTKLKEELVTNTEENPMLVTDNGPKTIDTNPDVNFALSLVPHLKTIPSDKKLDVQIQIITILKNATAKHARDPINFVKFERDDQSSDRSDDSDLLEFTDDK